MKDFKEWQAKNEVVSLEEMKPMIEGPLLKLLQNAEWLQTLHFDEKKYALQIFKRFLGM